MKKGLIGLAILALALAWVGYRMDVDSAGFARVSAWLVGTAFVVVAVLALLRRV